MLLDFFHHPPDGYHYEFQKFDSKHIRIDLHHHRKYDYNNGDSVSTIWGFYNTKTGKFHSPVNPKKIGKEVDISKTTPYSAMVPLNIL